MSKLMAQLGFGSVRQRRRADRFWESLHGGGAGSAFEDVGEDYRELDDRTVFQGTVSRTDCPVPLADLLRLYAGTEPEVSVTVPGQTLRFSRAWLGGSEGRAVLRGRIRYEIARRRAAGGTAAEEASLATAGWDPARVAELRTDFAATRTVDVSPYLVEVATGSGVSWACRGYAADGTIGISLPERDSACSQTEAAIRAALATRSDDRTRRALYERAQAPTVNRRGRDERRRTIADLIARGMINPGARPGDRLRDRFSRLHAAWDIPAVLETAVYTPLPGRVLQVGTSSTYGNYVRVSHDTIATPVVTNYCHLASTLVVARQRVVAGLAVGLAGNTGVANMPVHLHFSVQRPGAGLSSSAEASRGLDPREWFRSVAGTDVPYARR